MFCVAVAAVEAGVITRQHSARLLAPNIDPPLTVVSGSCVPLFVRSDDASCPADVYCSPVANVVVSSGAFTAEFHVVVFTPVGHVAPAAVFDDPNTACSAN